MKTFEGWLLDLYADPEEGVVVWFIGKDGKRHRLRQPFPVTFYAAAPAPRLRALWRFLRAQPTSVSLARTERRELFSKQPITVLAATVHNPAEQGRLFRKVSRTFPDVTFYDADIPLALRYHAVHNTFPLARCRVNCDDEGEIQALEALDSPWEIDYTLPPLRVLYLQPEVNPFHAEPRAVVARHDNHRLLMSMQPERALIVGIAALLRRYNPDLILTTWGDNWLLPHLLERAKALNIPLPLSRDPKRDVERRAARTYFSYGQVIYRGEQTRLFGRGHIDVTNAVLFGDYGLEGVLEMARVTGLPLQGAARLSPGTGISAMQIRTALQQGVLVPWHKQQAEDFKTAAELINADRGGLVYQPLIGLHAHVGEIDFISMYPSIMVHFNVSPETVGEKSPHATRVPALDLHIDRETPGLVPLTLAPLLEKRIALKTRMANLPGWDPRRKRYKAWASAHKWLLVTCFGYLGYKNARFGRIEAHEAVTAYGREALLRAKEAAEALGFTVLHMYVDGLWVKREGATTRDDFEPLLNAILERTGLPVALDGIYRWVAFLPSRMDKRVPVANRYFGVFQDGSIKMRGIEARREDTPEFIADLQQRMLERLAQVADAEALPDALPDLLRMLTHCVAKLRAGRIPLKHLLVSQKLSRELGEYRTPSPVAKAVAQLERVGKSVRPGQRVRLLYTLGEPGVYAWDLPQPPNPAVVDVERYLTLLLRAASTVFQPLGVDEETLRRWVLSKAGYTAAPGTPPQGDEQAPLWSIAARSKAVTPEQAG